MTRVVVDVFESVRLTFPVYFVFYTLLAVFFIPAGLLMSKSIWFGAVLFLISLLNLDSIIYFVLNRNITFPIISCS